MSTSNPTVDALPSDDVDVPRRWFGATLDLEAVRRDAVLVGGFSGMNALAGTLDWAWLPAGAFFGAVLGSVLHLMPAKPQPDDSRRGRIIVRAITGFVGGGWAGLGFGFVQSGVAANAAIAPTAADLVPNLLVGAVTGMAWYIGWGFWETRKLATR